MNTPVQISCFVPPCVLPQFRANYQQLGQNASGPPTQGRVGDNTPTTARYSNSPFATHSARVYSVVDANDKFPRSYPLLRIVYLDFRADSAHQRPNRQCCSESTRSRRSDGEGFETFSHSDAGIRAGEP